LDFNSHNRLVYHIAVKV